MKATIDFAKANTTDKGKSYRSYKINDEWYSDWTGSNFEKGDEVEFEFEQNGKFRNIKKITKFGEGTESSYKSYDTPTVVEPKTDWVAVNQKRNRDIKLGIIMNKTAEHLIKEGEFDEDNWVVTINKCKTKFEHILRATSLRPSPTTVHPTVMIPGEYAD